jgi:exodeoxyribonuclease V alpha subunit
MSLLQALVAGGWLRTVDHALGRSLRHVREETPDWVQVAAALASRALAQGHSQLPLAQAEAFLADVDVERAPPPLPEAGEWRAMLAASPWVHVVGDADPQGAREADALRGTGAPADRILVLEGGTIALRRYHDLELRLARALLARADQAAPRLQLVTGGPGTGKTTRVAQLLVDAARAHDASATTPLRVLLAAPTGKAASRLSESVRESLSRQVLAGTLDARIAARLPTESSTVHRLLGWQGRDGFRHHRDNPLPADLVVVDEASMIDLPLMCRLVEAVAPAAQLVLVGDRDQLPSVDIGDVLAALCDASDAAGSPLAAADCYS